MVSAFATIINEKSFALRGFWAVVEWTDWTSEHIISRWKKVEYNESIDDFWFVFIWSRTQKVDMELSIYNGFSMFLGRRNEKRTAIWWLLHVTMSDENCTLYGCTVSLPKRLFTSWSLVEGKLENRRNVKIDRVCWLMSQCHMNNWESQ